jgi:hypothetical protein
MSEMNFCPHCGKRLPKEQDGDGVRRPLEGPPIDSQQQPGGGRCESQQEYFGISKRKG